VIIWQTGMVRLLPRLLRGRTSGPVFLTERARPAAGRRPRPGQPPGSAEHEQAEALFRRASGGATLHQLRHSALTHDAEDRMSR
jgi:integrase/recombinase XerC/integrase/recombinase XerD